MEGIPASHLYVEKAIEFNSLLSGKSLRQCCDWQVCGSDGVSYGNECKLRLENCEARKNTTVLHQGLCSEHCFSCCN
jgi:hypothetical protein